ncbi:MAG: RNase adapter RapZ [Acetobacteraceae bacterium]|nr:RNase adapter RapZ [Acetobacteraceae bacterium]
MTGDQVQKPDTGPRRVVLVTGLSGSGKASILHALEDVGYDAVDNLPIGLLEDVATRADRDIAIGIDARTRGFDAELILATLASMRRNAALLPELVFVWADEATLLGRYTETRRRHPMAPRGRVATGIEIEQEMTARLRDTANLIIDTSDLPLAGLRRLIEDHFGPRGDENDARMVVLLISFAYAKGLPREADLVFDARFLRNPHYDPHLRPRTGLDPEVGAYIRADKDYSGYLSGIIDLVDLVLPRFVHEGKKYATIAIGCTGGRHRSVWLVERLAAHLSARLAAMHAAGESGLDWRQTVTHRELNLADRSNERSGGARSPERDVGGRDGGTGLAATVTGLTAERADSGTGGLRTDHDQP